MTAAIEESDKEYGVMFYSLMCIFLQKVWRYKKLYLHLQKK